MAKDILEELTLGADPEVFLMEKASGKVVPSVGRLGGSKLSPRQIRYGYILEDNVTAEFNTAPVKYADGPQAFVDSIVNARDELASIVAPLGLSLLYSPVAQFSPMDLQSQQAQESGCDPDYNIYSNSQNEYPPLSESTFRYSGGHVHIGHPIIMSSPKFVKGIMASLDASIGAASALWDGLNQRQGVYGRLGNFRPKPYGLEYRSASNAWISDPKRIEFVRAMVAQAILDAAITGTDHSRRAEMVSKHIHAKKLEGVTEYMTGAAYEYGRKEKWW